MCGDLPVARRETPAYGPSRRDTFPGGGVAERSNAAVSKTVSGLRSDGGSNPPSSVDEAGTRSDRDLGLGRSAAGQRSSGGGPWPFRNRRQSGRRPSWNAAIPSAGFGPWRWLNTWSSVDGRIEAIGAVFEAKFMLPWSFSEETAAEKHMAQLQHNMSVTNARGHGLRAKRSRSGAVSFDLLDTEATRAAIQ